MYLMQYPDTLQYSDTDRKKEDAALSPQPTTVQEAVYQEKPKRSSDFALGIDVGGTKIQGAFLREGMVVLTSKRPTPTSYQAFLTTLEALAVEVDKPVQHIGIGIPGTASDTRVTWVPNLPFLDGKDLSNDLGQRLEAQVVIANDAQLALLGEVWQGAAQGRESAALISVGTGVGGALMFNGKIIRGVHGSAGSFGWVNLDWNAPLDANHGHVELHASGRALEESGWRLDPPLTPYEIIAQARANSPNCQRIVTECGRMLGATLACIASITDPEILIFSGGLADAFDLFAEPLRTGLRAFGSPSVRETPIVCSQLGKHAAAYGALRASMLQQAMWH